MHEQSTAQAAFHPNDPRRLAREALAGGEVEKANAWAALATAEALHRLAKAFGQDPSRDRGGTP